jgi:hypothetical protein
VKRAPASHARDNDRRSSARKPAVRATSLPSRDLVRAAVARVVGARTIASTLAGLAAEIDRHDVTDADLSRAITRAVTLDGGRDE